MAKFIARAGDRFKPFVTVSLRPVRSLSAFLEKFADGRIAIDRHKYQDEKRRAFMALASLLERITDPQANIT